MTPSSMTLLGARCWDGDAWIDAPIHLQGGLVVERPARDGVVVDLRDQDATVLPGLVDAHTHLGIPPLHPNAAGMTDVALDDVMLQSARIHIKAGVTTVRDLGELRGRNHVWAERQHASDWTGPRIVQYGTPLTVTDGHCAWMGHACDGPDAAGQAARRELELGADGVKLMVSGGLSSRGTDARGLLMDAASIEAACDVARNRSAPVAAHVMGGPGLQTAARMGVTSIEHGYWMSREDADVMAAHGVTWVPTMTVPWLVAERVPFGDATPSEAMAQLAREAREAQHASVQHALAAGLHIVAGTDYAPGTLADEIRLMSEAGVPTDDALRAATSSAATLLRLEDVGHLRTGAQADVFVVQGDPRRDIRVLTRPMMVIRGGVVVHDERANATA